MARCSHGTKIRHLFETFVLHATRGPHARSLPLQRPEALMKRLVICADGTWNVRDQIDDESGKRRPTNVTKVARAIRPRDSHGVDQVVFYHDGLGTRGPLDRMTGGAFGSGIEANVRNLYRTIVYNYQPGDEIYLFGFSRGAFTVRTLAGFMNKVGLIEKDDDYYLPEIYACYEQNNGPGTKEWQRAFRGIRGTRPCPPIRFVGVWDTVGSLGAPGVIGNIASALNGNKYAYHDVGLNSNIRNAYHALAIDERRKPFKPTLWSRPDGWDGTLQQAWFAGVHCSVGGGYSPDGLANEALHWMVEKAEALGLEFDGVYLKPFRPCFNSKRHESMSAKYRLFGSYLRAIGNHVADGELVHRSALDRRAYMDGTPRPAEKYGESKYAPANLETFIARIGSALPIAETQRVQRGAPCKEKD
jgi:uncharacterized protein (DUF2235 family)